MATDPSTVDLHGSASRRPPLEGTSSLRKKCRRAIAQRDERSDYHEPLAVPTTRAHL